MVPVSASHRELAAALCADLARAGLRSRLDADNETLARRIAAAHHDGVPFVAIVGERERQHATLSIRARDARWSQPASDAIAELARRCAAT